MEGPFRGFLGGLEAREEPVPTKLYRNWVMDVTAKQGRPWVRSMDLNPESIFMGLYGAVKENCGSNARGIG